MLFTSWEFAAFALPVFLLYFLTAKRVGIQNLVLLLSSYFFYAYWDWRFMTLVWVSTLVDFYVSARIPTSQPSVRKRLLWLSIATNLGILGFFKYFDFFVGSAVDLSNALGLPASAETLGIILPLGISFYTFQTMSYTIDVYRGEIEPSDSLLEFALYVCFFPQLVAGPIERASSLLPQIRKPRHVSANDIFDGVSLILIGLLFKLAVADNAIQLYESVMADKDFGGMDIYVAVLAYAVAIYADFSGYSKIARGLARLLGFELSINFKVPYAAITPSDFWRRWHVTLSEWLRDYLYIPLGGNRHGPRRTLIALFLTMLLGGLWHGASWNFVLWGALHGFILIVFRFLPTPSTLGTKVVSWFVMFQLTLFGWLLFAAKSGAEIQAALERGLFEPNLVAVQLLQLLLLIASPLILYDLIAEKTKDLLFVTKLSFPTSCVVYSIAVLWVCIIGVRESPEFIYFVF